MVEVVVVVVDQVLGRAVVVGWEKRGVVQGIAFVVKIGQVGDLMCPSLVLPRALMSSSRRASR